LAPRTNIAEQALPGLMQRISPPQKMTKAKPLWKMNPKELSNATEQFDRPFVVDESRPLTPAERDQWEIVRRKRGRPKVGKGFKRVSLSLEQDLLRRVTSLAKKRHISRSRLIALVLTDALAEETNANI
jgi:Ribbon-helix-helix protein, copG family